MDPVTVTFRILRLHDSQELHAETRDVDSLADDDAIDQLAVQVLQRWQQDHPGVEVVWDWRVAGEEAELEVSPSLFQAIPVPAVSGNLLHDPQLAALLQVAE
jgi:hypothetical protein